MKTNTDSDVKTESNPKAIANVSKPIPENKAKIGKSYLSLHLIFVDLYQVKALYDFLGENSDDLAFKKGEIIQVLEEIDESWSIGEIQTDSGKGRKGMFPRNYVEKVKNLPQYENQSDNFDEDAKAKPSIDTTKFLSMGITDMATAISSVKLNKSKPSVSIKETKPQVEAIADCSTCGCNEFSPNAFKKGHCNNCFHRH